MAEFRIHGTTLWKCLRNDQWVIAYSWNTAPEMFSHSVLSSIMAHVRNVGDKGNPRDNFLSLFDDKDKPAVVKVCLKELICADIKPENCDIIKERLKFYEGLKIVEIVPPAEMMVMIQVVTNHDVFKATEIMGWLYGEAADAACADAMAGAVLGNGDGHAT